MIPDSGNAVASATARLSGSVVELAAATGVGVGVAVVVGAGVGVGVGVGVFDGPPTGGVLVGDGLGVAVTVGLGDAVTVGDGEGVCDGEALGLDDGEADGDGEGEPVAQSAVISIVPVYFSSCMFPFWVYFTVAVQAILSPFSTGRLKFQLNVLLILFPGA